MKRKNLDDYLLKIGKQGFVAGLEPTTTYEHTVRDLQNYSENQRLFPATVRGIHKIDIKDCSYQEVAIITILIGTILLTQWAYQKKKKSTGGDTMNRVH